MRLISKAAEEAKLKGRNRVATGVDVVGDIAIVRLGGLTLPEKKRMAKAIMEEVKNVKGVFEQEGGIEGEFRVRKLRHLAGDKKTLTLHRENGCVFKVDVAKCYFSPRLSTERLRIVEDVRPQEKVLNMFAGVGPFSVAIAKLSGAKVTSWELNDYACDLHVENNKLNRVEGLVKVTGGDAAELADKTRLKFDRILMPHPSQADRFLPAALKLAKKGTMIHYYRHVLGKDTCEAEVQMTEELSRLVPPKTRRTIRKVREVGPRWLEMAADLKIAG